MATTELPDGTILPSHLAAHRGGQVGNSGVLTNLAFRLGEVKHIIYPSSPKSVSKTAVEYDVLVQQQNGGKTGVSMMYHNCPVANLFGGVADILRFTLRASSTQQASHQDKHLLAGNGSKVLLLCINGQTRNAVIIGGIRTPVSNDSSIKGSVDAQAEGHNLEFEFNGINFAIGDDGGMVLTFNGKTNANGSPADSVTDGAQGSTIAMTADGNISVTSPDMLQTVTIDNANHKVTIDADTEMDLNCSGPVNIIASGLNIGAATNALLLGSNYRFNDTLMNTQLSALATSISTLMTTAGTALASASVAGAVPIVGGILQAPFLATAGATLLAVTPLMVQWGAAIDAFEVQAKTYLSTKNFHD